MGTTNLQTVGLLIDIFAAAILVTAFLIVSSRSLGFYIRLFALQSLFLGVVAFLVVVGYGETHILIAAILTIAIKAIAIPIVLTRMIERIQVQKEIDFSINITASLLLCGGMVILADSVAQSILGSQQWGHSRRLTRALRVHRVDVDRPVHHDDTKESPHADHRVADDGERCLPFGSVDYVRDAAHCRGGNFL